MTVEDNDGWRSVSDVTEEDEALREDEFKDLFVPEEGAEEVVDSSDEEEIEIFPEFDTKWTRDFTGLTYLGYLEGKVEIPYHSFTVRTLKVGEKIKVTEIIKNLEDSIGYARAYRAAIAAAGLVLVDGEPLLVGSKKIDAIAQKYQYITDNWHDFVVDILYEKINELEGRVIEILTDLGIYEDRRQVGTVEGAVTAGSPEKD